MKTFLQNLFAPTVDSLAAALHSTASRLDKHCSRVTRHAQGLYDYADQLEQQAKATRGVANVKVDEGLHAERVAAKVRALLS